MDGELQAWSGHMLCSTPPFSRNDCLCSGSGNAFDSHDGFNGWKGQSHWCGRNFGSVYNEISSWPFVHAPLLTTVLLALPLLNTGLFLKCVPPPFLYCWAVADRHVHAKVLIITTTCQGWLITEASVLEVRPQTADAYTLDIQKGSS